MKLLLALMPVAAFAEFDEADDDVNLLQVSLKGSQEIETDGIADTLKDLAGASDPAQAEALVQKLAQAAAVGAVRIDDETKTVLEGVKKTFQETSEVSLQASHENDEKLLSQHMEAIVSCGTTFTNSQDEDAQLSATVNDLEQSHKECRTTLQKMHDDMIDHCSTLDDFRKSLTAPSCAIPSGNGEMHNYLSGLKSFGTLNLEQWVRLDALCVEATDAYEAHHDDCGTGQGQFEVGFCELRVEVHETCYDYGMCYANAAAAHEQTEQSALSSADARKLEWTAIQKIKCYIDVLTSADEDDKRTEAMAKCQELELDTAHLDISQPLLPARAECDLSQVQDFPCGEGFLSRYQGMLALRTCVSCAALEPHLLNPDHGAKLEVGTIHTEDTHKGKDGTYVKTHVFLKPFAAEPVVVGLMSLKGSNPAQVSIFDVTKTGFSYAVVEPFDADGPHVSEAIDFIAAVPGVTEFGNLKIEAGMLSTSHAVGSTQLTKGETSEANGVNHEWEQLSFTAGFTETPAVMAALQSASNVKAQVMSMSGVPTTVTPWLVTATQKSSKDGAQVSLERAEVKDGSSVSVPEDIGYIAVSVGVGEHAGVKFAVQVYTTTGNSGFDDRNTVSSAPLAVPPPLIFDMQDSVIVGSMMTRNGGDGGWARVYQKSKDSVTVIVDEDKALNTERAHTKETFSVATFAKGFTFP